MPKAKPYFSWMRLTLVAAIATVAAAAMISVGRVSAEVRPQVESSRDRPITTLRDLNQAFIDIAAQVKPAVVTVSTERIISASPGQGLSPFTSDPFFDFFFGPQGHQRQQMPERKFRQRGLGSGVIINPDGYILTNNHVVENADSIYVRTYANKEFTAKVIGTDPKTDVAVIQIKADNLPYLEIGNSDSLQVGEIVMAIGSPMSENLAYTVTQGIVSATGRSNVGLADYEDFIQTDCAINPGNSGGPLVNMDGKLVGINTAIVSRTGGFEGIGFAVPSNMAKNVMTSLIHTGKVVRGWLGVTIQNIDQQIADAMKLQKTNGALIGDVLSDSPADKAGLQPGDLILEVNGTPIKNSSQLRNLIAGMAPGSTATLTIMRDESEKTISVKLGELPAGGMLASGGGAENQDRLGFAVSNIDDNTANEYNLDKSVSGVVVTSIDMSSEAYSAGLREGDVIRSFDQNRVHNIKEFSNYTSGLKKGEAVLLRVTRQGGTFFIAFRVG